MTPRLASRFAPLFAGLIAAAACSRPAPAAEPQAPQLAAPASPAVLASPTLDANQSQSLAAWFVAVGPRQAKQTFGSIVIRAAKAQLGKPYFDPPHSEGPEMLDCRLDSFQCVSLVESTLAAARCIWQNTPHDACFLREMQGLRYRNGLLEGYASRLHYYEEWFTDNARRGRLHVLTGELGGAAVSLPFFYMTANLSRFPALADPNVRAAIAAAEARLTGTKVSVLERTQIRVVERQLQDGDVIAVTGSHPGILVSHTGFVARDAAGLPHLLHASSFRKQVMLSEHDLAQYILRSADRRGIMVARPLPP